MRKVLAALLSFLLVMSLLSGTAFADSSMLNEPGMLPLVKSKVKLVIGTPAIATVTDYDNNHFTNYLREKTGVDIEVFLFDSVEYRSQLQLMITANEKLPDMLWAFRLPPEERESYGRQGYFIDLLPYFEAHKLTHYFDGEAASYLTEEEKSTTLSAGISSDGGLYAFPFWAVSVPDPWSNGLLINNTFCKALGLEIPTTIEEYYEYLVAVKTKDPNGNGINDEIPLVGFAKSNNGDIITNLLNSFLFYPATWEGTALCADDDGKIYVPYQQEAFKEGIRWIAKCYSEGLISDLSFSQDRYGLQAMTDLTGDAPDIVGSAMSHRSFMFASHAKAERRTHYTTIGPLVGSNGVAFASTAKSEPLYVNYITSDCEHPDVAFAVMDFLTSAESTLNARYGREGEYWRYATEEEIAGGSSWSELGYTDVLYTSANMKLAWGQQTNEIWNTTNITWQPKGFTALSPKPHYENPISQYNADDWNHGVMQRYGKAPKNLVGALAYTAEEIAQLGSAHTDIGVYVRECMTRFVIGEMNIDRDWEAFQTNLQTMGLDTVLACAQAAYDRAYK